MHLRTVELRDWKAYENARFDFPTPANGRNVILIGGENGFGKTSFFEALVLGLYGRDGIALILRAAAAADDSGRARSYGDFMRRALNGGAIAAGRGECRVRLTFEDEDGAPIEIERKWFYSDNGSLRAGAGAEDVRILRGEARRPVAPPRGEPDPEGWYRDWISRNFLPTHLAGFFLFDGEASSAYAERAMDQQVRDGIEGLLGLTWLRKLRDDLRGYAVVKRRELPRAPGDDVLRRLDEETAVLERELEEADRRLQEITAALLRAEPEREALTRELGRQGGATQAQLSDLIAERERHARELDRAEAELVRLVAEAGLPFALAGAALLARVEDRLAREEALELWQTARSQGSTRSEAVLRAIDDGLPAVRPALLPEQAEAVMAAVGAALDRLWNPPPPDAADAFRHDHARGPMNQRLRDRLAQAGGVTRTAVLDLVEICRSEKRALHDLRDRIAKAEAASPDRDALGSRLLELNHQIDAWREEKGQKENYIASRAPQLEQKRKEIARHAANQDNSARPARLARRADEVAEMLDGLIEEARTQQSGAIAVAMTTAIRAMAHRGDLLNRVDITHEYGVTLLTEGGRDLREFDLSAGEKQVFSQALFAAVAEVSRRIFPLVIDTPLGRLDETHRVNVLRFLADRAGQVILVSTNTEVVGQYLDAIRPRIAASFLLRNTTTGTIGRSAPAAGYFPGQGL